MKYRRRGLRQSVNIPDHRGKGWAFALAALFFLCYALILLGVWQFRELVLPLPQWILIQ
jgi:hypothetical protein